MHSRRSCSDYVAAVRSQYFGLPVAAESESACSMHRHEQRRLKLAAITITPDIAIRTNYQVLEFGILGMHA